MLITFVIFPSSKWLACSSIQTGYFILIIITGKSMNTRAILHPTFDCLVSEVTRVPIAAYEIWHHSANRMRIRDVIIKALTDILLEIVRSAMSAYGIVRFTDRFGILALPVLMVIMSIIGIFWYIFYITKYLVFWSRPLRYNELGRDLRELAQRVGYSDEKIRISVSDTFWRDSYYFQMLNYDLVMIARRLTDFLIPIQVTAVVAHELGHWKYRHKTISGLFQVVEDVGCCCALVMSYNNEVISNIFGFKKNETHHFIPLYLTYRYIYPMCSKSFRGISNVVMRACVFQADGFASDLGLAAQLRSALLIMAATCQNLPMFDRWHSAWYDGEPTIFERIVHLNKRAPKPNVTFRSIASVTSVSVHKTSNGEETEEEKESIDNDKFVEVLEGTRPQEDSPEELETPDTKEVGILRTTPSKFAVHRKSSGEARPSIEKDGPKQKKLSKNISKGSSAAKQATPQLPDVVDSPENQGIKDRTPHHSEKHPSSSDSPTLETL